ncbi:MAG: HAMP domain-containing histidine kinase [Bacteroidales bacterium]|nr:HAMP domain-containing histidine kinase [Bacteroidales bacterium]
MNFRKEANDALRAVLDEEVEEVAYQNFKSGFLKSTDHSLSLSSDQTVNNKKNILEISDSTGQQNAELDPAEIQRIFNQILLTLVSTRPDIRVLEKKYRTRLAERGIEIPFILALKREGKVVEMTGNDPGVFKNAQAIQRIPGRIKPEEQMVAFFPEKTTFVLKGMWMTLLASFLLVCLIAGSFVLMLRTLYKQKKLSEIKNDFINNMTHELKTPIATVSAAMEALVNFQALNDPERGFKYIDLSRKELSRLSGMVENVLAVSKFGEQRLLLNMEEFDLVKLIHEIAQRFIMKDPDKITVEFDLPLEQIIHADRLHIHNVISNLIDNAVKYTTGHSVIRIGCEEKNNYIVVTVKDNGIGIAKDQYKRIFEKFYRVPTGDLHAVKGFGLGLSYVKQVIEAHKGTVGVYSQPGSGSTFSIAIPVLP